MRAVISQHPFNQIRPFSSYPFLVEPFHARMLPHFLENFRPCLIHASLLSWCSMILSRRIVLCHFYSMRVWCIVYDHWGVPDPVCVFTYMIAWPITTLTSLVILKLMSCLWPPLEGRRVLLGLSMQWCTSLVPELAPLSLGPIQLGSYCFGVLNSWFSIYRLALACFAWNHGQCRAWPPLCGAGVLLLLLYISAMLDLVVIRARVPLSPYVMERI